MPRKKVEAENLEALSVDELVEKWRQIKDFLSSLEDDYRNAEVSEDAYKEAKEKNERKLKQMGGMITDWGISLDEIQSKAAPAPGAAAEAAGPAKEAKPAAETVAAEEEADEKPEPPKAKKGAKAAEPVNAAAPIVVAAAPGMSMDVVEAKIAAKSEKMSATIDSVKEAQNRISERLQTLAESIGEFRSQGSQRESVVKELQSRLETVMEQVAEIDPQRFSKELQKRDKSSSQQDMRLEKIEMKVSQVTSTVGEIRKTLESIGGLENIAEVSREIGKKMSQVSSTYSEMTKLASRTERIYLELNKRMEDFAVYKSKQEGMEELAKDMVRSIDTLNVRMENYVTLESFDNLKKNLSDLEMKINALADMIGKLIPIARMKIPEEVRDLQEEREAVQAIMESLESEYNEGKMAKARYEVAKKKNVEKLGRVQEALRKEWDRFEKMVTRSSGQAGPEAAKAAEKAEAAGGKAESSPGPVEARREGAEPEPMAEQEKEDQSKPIDAKAAKREEAEETAKEAAGGRKGKNRAASDGKGSGIAQKAKEKAMAKGKEKAGKEAAPKTSGGKQSSKPGGKGMTAKTEPKPMSEKERMLAALEDSFKRGKLSKEAYERSRKLLEGM